MFGDADERPHLDQPGGSVETWSFTTSIPDPDMIVVVSLAWHPDRHAGWYLGALVPGSGRPVLVVDDEVPLRRPSPSLELRTEGLWGHHVCEQPFEHWTVGLEAFGVEVDDLVEAVGRPWGDRVGLGYDLEWEATGPPAPLGGDRPGYRVDADVSGEILVGHDEHPAVEGTGWWTHSWRAPATDCASWAVDALVAAGVSR